MQTESAHGAPPSRSPMRPSGLRRLSLAMMATDHIASSFKGTPEGHEATRPGQVLAAFKAAAPYLGFSPRVVHVIDWLFTFTQPQDWAEGSRPIVWPSAELQRAALSVGPTQAKALNRHLTELGLVAMKDSPNGKRYGRRDGKGRIVEAYGFDLSPLFERRAEFQEIALKGRAEREQLRRLRRRSTIARNGLLQIFETATEQGLMDSDWRQLESQGMALARSLRQIERVDEMEFGVASLERRQAEARERLEKLLAGRVATVEKSVDSDPKEPENRPHIITTKQTPYPEQDTVMASRTCSRPGASAGSPPDGAMRPYQPQAWESGRSARTDHGTVLKLGAEELVDLAPRIRPYLASPTPSWPEIVTAAEWLRHDLGVSRPLWGEACQAMGRERAAVALAIVSTKPASYFSGSPGGYFHGMVAKAKAGELNLERTIWGLRRRDGENSKLTGRERGSA